MPKVWITYAWADNASRDVDFLAQEIESAGVSVRLDRWTIGAGQRLWSQIEKFIVDPEEADAWLLYATQTSLGSEPCREEFAYALDRALASRSSVFPVIALFPGKVESNLLPAGLRTRLCVSLTDPDWKERICAAVQGRSPDVARAQLQPYHLAHHTSPDGRHVVEVRPRAGTWAPFVAAVPIAEKENVQFSILHGPAGRVPMGGILMLTGESDQQDWFVRSASNEATPTSSYFLFFKALPSKLVFGIDRGKQYNVTFEAPRARTMEP